MDSLGVEFYVAMDTAPGHFSTWLSIHEDSWILDLGDDLTLEAGVGLEIRTFLEDGFEGEWYDILNTKNPKAQGVFCATLTHR
jgi:hypothetical protein